jgi:DNA-binding winged helix-turn-helix (wHTH) protein
MAIYRFGEFEVNEESRGLRLAGRELEIQPLVFDFLSILLRHQDRALSKAELLDTLWPGVTVTEASLQRVASLARSLLRQGGIETALRNLPRFGYQICLDLPPGPTRGDNPEIKVAAHAASAGSRALAARAAVSARKWQEAATAFSEAEAADELLTADRVE